MTTKEAPHKLRRCRVFQVRLGARSNSSDYSASGRGSGAVTGSPKGPCPSYHRRLGRYGNDRHAASRQSRPHTSQDDRQQSGLFFTLSYPTRRRPHVTEGGTPYLSSIVSPSRTAWLQYSQPSAEQSIMRCHYRSRMSVDAYPDAAATGATLLAYRPARPTTFSYQQAGLASVVMSCRDAHHCMPHAVGLYYFMDDLMAWGPV